MSWIDFCNYLFYAIVFTSMTGSIFTLIWMLLERTVLKNDCVLADKLLRIVLHTFAIPVLFVIVIVRHKDDTLALEKFRSDVLVSGKMFRMSPFMCEVITIVMSLWLFFVIGACIYWARQAVKLRRLLKASIPEDDTEVLKRFAQLCESLQIKKTIALLRNDMISIPFTTGVRRQSIVLPFSIYSEKELGVILAHELGHCRNRDLCYKLESVVVNLVQGWNPLFYFVRKKMSEFMEYACDVGVCVSCKQWFSTKEYFSIILQETLRCTKEKNGLSVALTESKSELERRLINMKRHQTKGAVKKGLAAVIALTFVLGGSLTAYAAGNGVVDAQDRLYEETRETVLDSDNNVIEYVRSAEDVESVPTTVIEENTSAARKVVNIDWEIPAGEKYQTTFFTLSAGDQVTVAIATTPTGEQVEVGLIYPNYEEHFVYCTGQVGHTFTVTMSGKYSFYIYNDTDVDVTAVGVYIR